MLQTHFSTLSSAVGVEGKQAGGLWRFKREKLGRNQMLAMCVSNLSEKSNNMELLGREKSFNE